MAHGPNKPLHKRLADAIRRVLRKREEDPDDPYALVGAPKKPRTPLRSAAAEAELTKQNS